MNTSRELKAVIKAAFAASLLSASAAQAEIINLTNQTFDGVVGGDSGSITTKLGTVTFSRDFVQPAGTGVFEPFLTIQRNGEEQGYNTSGGEPFDTKRVDAWTYDVKINDLVAKDGYYEFLLDINEANSDNNQGDASLLSLDGLRLYATNTPSQTDETTLGADTSGDWAGPADSVLLWDLDMNDKINGNGAGDYQDNLVLLDADLGSGPQFPSPGSGISDMRMFVPEAIIKDGGAGYSNFILWSRFGITVSFDAGADSSAGFEEWAGPIRSNDNPGGGPSVPVPAPLALLGLGAFLLGRRIRS